MSDTVNNPDSGKETRSDNTSQRKERRQALREWREDWRESRHQPHQEYWESRITGALTLIIVGIILLLNTTGVLAWGVWLNILRFWPLFIVSVGISIIFGGSRIMKFIGSILTFAIFLVVVLIAVFNPLSLDSRVTFPFNIGTNAQAQKEIDIIKQEDYSNVESKTLNLDLPLGNVQVNDSASNDYLNVETSFYTDSEKPVITKSLDNNVLSLDISNNKQTNFNFATLGPTYKVELGQTYLKSDLTMKFGAGNSNVDLESQLIKNFSAEVGAGNLELKMSRTAVPDESFNLKNGLGNIKLTLPSNVGLKINYKVGLGNISFNNEKIASGAGNSSFSTHNYNIVNKNVVINVEVGLGNVNIFTD